MNTKRIENVHFIGIGGVGMSGIARIAHEKGMVVSGSDLKESRYTKQLRDLGIKVFIGHSPENVPAGNPVIVVSTAILDNNPELIEVKKRGLEIWHRAQMLAHLGSGLKTLAVAGTHGKTTTSSMLASALVALGKSPTYLIGGIVRESGTNACSGSGQFYVVEADESDKSFTYLSPETVLITNIEADHLDHYRDINEIYDKFLDFMKLVPEAGTVVVCAESEKLCKLAAQSCRRVVTYGTASTCDVCVKTFVPKGIGSEYELEINPAIFPGGVRDTNAASSGGENGATGKIKVTGAIKQNPGVHNVLNAAGVVTLLATRGFDAQKVADALRNFAGVRRRFDLVGEVSGVSVVDDYAHHPTEIAATLKAALSLNYKHVHVLFQPHRYSRVGLFTEVLHDEFASAFDGVETVTFMDVFPAGETPVPGVSGKTFLDVVLQHSGHPKAEYVPRRIDVVPHIMQNVSAGDLVITMGAGDVSAIGPQIIDALLARRG